LVIHTAPTVLACLRSNGCNSGYHQVALLYVFIYILIYSTVYTMWFLEGVLLLARLSNCHASWIFYDLFMLYWHALVAMAAIQDLIKWLYYIYIIFIYNVVSLGWFFCSFVLQNILEVGTSTIVSWCTDMSWWQWLQ
jgi:hypothetical protein